jgi:hypothetical protein
MTATTEQVLDKELYIDLYRWNTELLKLRAQFITAKMEHLNKEVSELEIEQRVIRRLLSERGE